MRCALPDGTLGVPRGCWGAGDCMRVAGGCTKSVHLVKAFPSLLCGRPILNQYTPAGVTTSPQCVVLSQGQGRGGFITLIAHGER